MPDIHVYSVDEAFRAKKDRRNKGEVRKVYVKKAHEPIIDPETFDAVQREMIYAPRICGAFLLDESTFPCAATEYANLKAIAVGAQWIQSG